MLPGIGPRGSDHDTATAASIGQSLLRELDVIIAFLQRAGSGVLGESTIPMFDSKNLCSLLEE